MNIPTSERFVFLGTIVPNTRYCKDYLTIFLAVLPIIFFAQSIKAQWHELPGPPSGPVNAFAAIDSSANGRIYAATANGVYRTADTGRSWQLMGLLNRNVLKITWYKIKGEEVLLAIVKDNNIDRVSISYDSAKTWDTSYTATTEPLLEIFQDGNDIVLGTGGSSLDTNAGIFRSTNLGRSWTHQAPGPPGYLTDFTLGEGFIFAIVGNDSGLWDMPSASNTWGKSSYPAFHNAQSILVAGQDIVSQELFVGGVGRIDVSTDKGVTWLPIAPYGLDTTTDIISTFAVNGLTIIAAGPNGAYITTDGGANWQHHEGTGGYPRAWVNQSIAFIDNQFFAGTGAGVAVSSDGSSWYYATDGLVGSALDVISNDTLLFALTQRGVFRSSDQGMTWITPNGGNDLQDSLATTFASVDGNIYAMAYVSGLGIMGQGLWKWNGSRWVTLTDLPVSSIVEQNAVLYTSAQSSGVIVSSDGGANWENMSVGLPDTASTMLVIAIPGKILAFEYSFWYSQIEVYASGDGAESWQLASGLGGTGFVGSGTMAGSNIYVVMFDGALVISSDFGNTWTFQDQNAVQIRNYGSGAVATTYDSVYILTPWESTLLVDTLTSLITGFTFDKQYAYAATTSRGLWAASLNNLPLSVATESPEYANVFSIQVYPNPAESNAMISFYLPDREAISLRIFDECGVCRAIPFEGIAGPGETIIPISFALPPGAYVAQLAGNRGNANARIIIENANGH